MELETPRAPGRKKSSNGAVRLIHIDVNASSGSGNWGDVLGNVSSNPSSPLVRLTQVKNYS